MRYLIVTVSFVCSLFAASAHAFDENLEFMNVTLPLGWSVAESDADHVVFETRNQEASFVYKKVPIHYVTLETYSRALMKAYVGYNFKKRTESIYYFEYLHGDKRAWTLVTYFKGRKDTFAIQTGIGESSDFISIMESIELK